MMNNPSRILKFTLAAFLALLFLVLITGSSAIQATEKRIYDKAELLSSQESEALEQMISEYEPISGIEIYILTHNDKNSAYPEKYIEDFEDQLPVGDRVYFLYDKSRKEVFMAGFGLAESYIHSKRIDKIIDAMIDDLRNNDFSTAFETYITMSAAYMEDDSELNYDHNYDNTPNGFDKNNHSYDDYYDYDYDSYYKQDTSSAFDTFLSNIPLQLGLSALIGIIVVSIMAYHSGGKMTARTNDYMDRQNSKLIGRRDIYLRTVVTKVKAPTQNSSGSGSKGGFNAGGFRGGTSSGGRSHSSGGRKL